MSSKKDLERDLVNPYRSRSLEFPGRIFSTQLEVEQQSLRSLIESSSERFVELGSGSGNHLIALAERNPQVHCFGFEIRYKRAVRTIEKSLAQQVPNSFVIRDRAERLCEFFEPQSVSKIFINFPDPWAKAKQRKNRLFKADFLDSAAKVLRSQGLLLFKTDHAEYFSSVLGLLSKSEHYQIMEFTTDLYASEYLPGNIPTEFEQLFISKGEKICYLKAAARNVLRTAAV